MTSDATAEQCVALIDYDAQFPDEISFRRGDILHVTHKGGHSGYWLGYVAYPASASAALEAAMRCADAGDEKGAAQIMAGLAGPNSGDEPSGALWPAQATEVITPRSEDEDDEVDAVHSETVNEPHNHALQPPSSPSQTSSEKTSSTRRKGRRAVIASFFSSLKGHKRRDDARHADETDDSVASPVEALANDRLAPSPPSGHNTPTPASLAKPKKKPHKSQSHRAPPQPGGERTASQCFTSTVGREGLFPNCVVSSNVAPDLALMRAFQQKCLALFAYKARDATELSFEAEDVLTAVRPGPAPGWWYGYNVSALEPVRRQARRQGRRHSRTRGSALTAQPSFSSTRREDSAITETDEAAEEKTPDRGSLVNPPLALSPFLFARCSQRWDEDEENDNDHDDGTTTKDSETGGHPLAHHEDSECDRSFLSTSTGSVGSTLTEPHHWTFLRAMDPATRAMVEARCGTPRKPLLFPTNYVTSDIVLTIFRFDRRQPHELSIDIGDVVRVHRRWNDGWWEGSLRGQRGIFPSNYTIPNVPSLRDAPFGATGTTGSTVGEDDHDHIGSAGGGGGASRVASSYGPWGTQQPQLSLASTMAAMTFPTAATGVALHTPLSPYSGVGVESASFSRPLAEAPGPAPVFFCPLCKTVLAVESRVEVMQNAATCRTCEQHRIITDTMLRSLEAYACGGVDTLDLFEKVPVFPGDVTMSEGHAGAAASSPPPSGVPPLLTSKDVADVSFGRIKFV